MEQPPPLCTSWAVAQCLMRQSESSRETTRILRRDRPPFSAAIEIEIENAPCRQEMEDLAPKTPRKLLTKRSKIR